MSSRDLIISWHYLFLHLKIISAVMPDRKIFFWIAASVADAAVVNPNGTETLLTNGFSALFIKGKPDFSNGPKSLPKNSPDWSILGNWVLIILY